MNSDHIPGGYILLARQMLESELMDKPPLWSKLWAWMLLRACFRDHPSGLKRGQFHTSIEEMREAMSHMVGYRRVVPSVKEIRRAYEGLTKGSMVGTMKGTRGMVVTILNYDRYQNPKNYEGHNEGHNERSTNGKERAQDREEGKNIRKESEELSTPKFPGIKSSAALAEYLRLSSLPEKLREDSLLDEYASFTCRFLAYQMEHHPTLVTDRGMTKGKVEGCVRALHQLVRLDGYDWEGVVKPTIYWAAKDEFWSKNVLSLASLREKGKNRETKFVNILAKREEESSRGSAKNWKEYVRDGTAAPDTVSLGGDDWKKHVRSQ